MYERKIAELIKQLADEQERLVEAKKHVSEHQRSMQVFIFHPLKISNIFVSIILEPLSYFMDVVAIPFGDLLNIAIGLS